MEENKENVEPRERLTPLVDLLCKFNGSTCMPQTLHRIMQRNHAKNLAYLQQLTPEAEYGPKIVTTHLKENMEIRPDMLTRQGADRTFALRGYLRITVR